MGEADAGNTVTVNVEDLLMLVTNISYMHVENVEELATAAARTVLILREWDSAMRS